MLQLTHTALDTKAILIDHCIHLNPMKKAFDLAAEEVE